jgi:hypothetical protein
MYKYTYSIFDPACDAWIYYSDWFRTLSFADDAAFTSAVRCGAMIYRIYCNGERVRSLLRKS